MDVPFESRVPVDHLVFGTLHELESFLQDCRTSSLLFRGTASVEHLQSFEGFDWIKKNRQLLTSVYRFRYFPSCDDSGWIIQVIMESVLHRKTTKQVVRDVVAFADQHDGPPLHMDHKWTGSEPDEVIAQGIRKIPDFVLYRQDDDGARIETCLGVETAYHEPPCGLMIDEEITANQMQIPLLYVLIKVDETGRWPTTLPDPSSFRDWQTGLESALKQLLLVDKSPQEVDDLIEQARSEMPQGSQARTFYASRISSWLRNDFLSPHHFVGDLVFHLYLFTRDTIKSRALQQKYAECIRSTRPDAAALEALHQESDCHLMIEQKVYNPHSPGVLPAPSYTYSHRNREDRSEDKEWAQAWSQNDKQLKLPSCGLPEGLEGLAIALDSTVMQKIVVPHRREMIANFVGRLFHHVKSPYAHHPNKKREDILADLNQPTTTTTTDVANVADKLDDIRDEEKSPSLEVEAEDSEDDSEAEMARLLRARAEADRARAEADRARAEADKAISELQAKKRKRTEDNERARTRKRV